MGQSSGLRRFELTGGVHDGTGYTPLSTPLPNSAIIIIIVEFKVVWKVVYTELMCVDLMKRFPSI